MLPVKRLFGVLPVRKVLAGVVLVALACGLLSGVSLAAERPPSRECWRLIQQAAEFKAAGRLEECIPLWRQAIALEQRYTDETALLRQGTFWREIAKACEKLGRYEDAVRAYVEEARAWSRLVGGETGVTPEWYRYDLARVESLRMEADLYREVPAAPPSSALAKHEPAAGCYLGGFFEFDPEVGTDPARAESAWGRRHAAVLVYVDWGNPLPGWAVSAARRGYALQVALQPVRGLEAVTDGPYLQGLVREIAGLGVPVFLRFAAEMNGDWTSWSGNPALYVEKFRLVAEAAREAPNVAVVWCPNHAPEDNIAEYYPGDEYVDWVGVNFYSDYYMCGNPSEPLESQFVHHQGKLASPLEKLDYVYAMFADRKPVMVCEFGAAHRSVTTGEDVTSWGLSQLGMLYGYLPLRFPRVKAVFYFSADQGSPLYPAENRWSDYCITDSPAFRDCYRRLAALPYYLGGTGESSPVAYRPLEEVGLASGSNRLFCYARMPYPFAGKVEYFWDGVLLAGADVPPFAASLEFRPDGRVHYLLVRVTSGDGGQMKEVLYAIDPSGRVVRQAGAEVPRASFPDLEGRRDGPYAERLAALGVVSGFPDGSFRPAELVTRAQFLKMLWRALGLEARLRESAEVRAHLDRALGRWGGGGGVPGVPAGHWAEGVVASAVFSGVVDLGLYPRGFVPDDPVLRWEMAALAAKALGASSGGPPGFADDGQIPEPARGFVAAVRELGIMSGDPGGRFRPLDGASRGEAAKVVVLAAEALARGR